MTTPNWAGGWRPAGYRPAPIRRRVQPCRAASPGRSALLTALRVALDGLAWTLLALARLLVHLVAAALRLLIPSVGAGQAVKRVGRIR